MGVESRLREIHHSLSCLTPKLFTSTIFMTKGWERVKQVWIMNTIPPFVIQTQV